LNTVFYLGFMSVVGALIGGVTNSLAIKMLFRPYNAIYVAGVKLPFTPGLIPKRREELALQLGRMVVEHLLTPEGIRRKLTEEAFVQGAIKWGQEQLGKWFRSDKTISDLLSRLGVENPEITFEAQLIRFVKNTYEQRMGEMRRKTVGEILPEELTLKIETKFPAIADYIIGKGIEYFESAEGKHRVKKMIDDFLMSRGMLGNMLQMFLGNVSLEEKVQPEIIKFLTSAGTRELLVRLLVKEWERVKSYRISEVETFVGKERAIIAISDFLVKSLGVRELLRKPLSELTAPYNHIINESIPSVVHSSLQFIAGKVEGMIERLQLQEVVRSQVETFSVERLEEMILSISRREFKMITYLGALLGGMIGLVQGIIGLFVK